MKDSILEIIAKAYDGDVDAQIELGDRYSDGDELDVNLEEAFFWYSKASKTDNPIALSRLGYCYFYGEDVDSDNDQAFLLFQKSHDQENDVGTYYVALCYLEGYGVHKDLAKAEELFAILAEKKDEDAMYQLGCIYLSKESDQYSRKSFRLFLESAKEGQVSAMCELGLCYLHGHGTDVDEKKALEWLTKSAQEDCESAQWELGDCYYWGTETIEIDYEMAFKWYQASALQGNNYAKCCLADCYYFGEGVVEDEDKAMELYNACANENYAHAMYRLGVVEMEKETPDMEIAQGWFKLASDLGDEDAIEELRKLSD